MDLDLAFLLGKTKGFYCLSQLVYNTDVHSCFGLYGKLSQAGVRVNAQQPFQAPLLFNANAGSYQLGYLYGFAAAIYVGTRERVGCSNLRKHRVVRGSSSCSSTPGISGSTAALQNGRLQAANGAILRHRRYRWDLVHDQVHGLGGRTVAGNTRYRIHSAVIRRNKDRIVVIR